MFTDLIDWISPAVAGAAAIVLVPIFMRAWKRAFPADSFSYFDTLGREQLERRNRWIDHSASLLFFVGLLSALIPYANGTPNNDPIGLAMGFGLAMWLPTLWIALVTLPRGGAQRLLEFLRWCEIEWGIARRGLGYFFVPLLVLAGFSLLYAERRYIG